MTVKWVEWTSSQGGSAANEAGHNSKPSTAMKREERSLEGKQVIGVVLRV
jgi:hypothetical protein